MRGKIKIIVPLVLSLSIFVACGEKSAGPAPEGNPGLDAFGSVEYGSPTSNTSNRPAGVPVSDYWYTYEYQDRDCTTGSHTVHDPTQQGALEKKCQKMMDTAANNSCVQDFLRTVVENDCPNLTWAPY